MTLKRPTFWRKRGLVLLGFVVVVFGVLLWLGGWSSERASTCFGSGSQGALRDAWKLPRKGANFRAYSDLGWFAGRTFVHSTVHQIVLDAYLKLEGSHPDHVFVYGETGLAAGGSFKPHRTHQNGLSVDFMVPVRNTAGAIAEIPTSVTQKFGYGLEFDKSGRLGDLEIDFEAIALHLSELKRSAARQHAKIARVVFEPELRERLARTRGWSDIKDLPFMTKSAWIRHDEHYHVDFEIACRPLAQVT
jgi:penicillin-insensitive murein DD-endopeptidase